jgi:cytoskeleton protein RodZ
LIPQLDVKNESRNVRSYHLGKFLPILFLLVVVGVAFAGWKWWKNYSVQTADSSAASWFNFSKKSSDQDAVPGNDTVDGQEDPTQLKLPEYTEQAFLPQINESANTSSPRPVKAQPANEPVSPPAQLQKLRPTATPAPVVQSPRLTDAAEALNENTSAQTINADSAAGTPVLSNTLPDTNTVQNTDIRDNKLVLDFSSDSWIRIRDADGNILAKDLQKKGTHLQLQGKRPYKVFLGDATGVTVRINNTVFDHSTYINEKKIARFEVE